MSLQSLFKRINPSSIALFASSIVSVVGCQFAITPASHAFSLSDVNPIYISNLDEKVFYDSVAPSSFGYFFDTTIDGPIVNALGVSIFPDWVNDPNSQPVTVSLWRFKGFDTAKVTYELIREEVLDPSNLPPVNGFGYYWLETPPISLGPATDPISDEGFTVAVSGNYLASSNFPFLEGGTGYFEQGYVFAGSGFNNSASIYYDDYPFPLDCVLDNDGSCDVTIQAYFNPNVSYYVPGPIPIFGAVAGFQMSRRFRRRIRGSR